VVREVVFPRLVKLMLVSLLLLPVVALADDGPYLI
jgi:hypothetical protein